MQRIKSYGPSIVLLCTAALILLTGPQVMRRLAHAGQEAEISQARAKLQANQTLVNLSQAFREVAKIVEPSVVHISIKSKQRAVPNGIGGDLSPRSREFFERFFGEPGRRSPERGPGQDGENMEDFDAMPETGNGSGWIFDRAGHIITNNHVVASADEIEVKFFDKTTRKAKVIGTDPQTDIAVLKVDTDDLHPASLTGDRVEQGDMVFAFGSPFRFEFSMSMGVVSGSNRQLGILGSGGYENFIQTDAAINPGNSGGPLTNIYGEVVGMNTAIATRTGAYNGIGFAIPTPMIDRVVKQLINTGSVSRGYLGVWIKDLDPKLARTFDYKGKGVLVEDLVDVTSPAAKAGLQRGDIVTHINGNLMPDAATLRRAVAAFPPNTTIEATYFRNGKTYTTKITLVEQPKQLNASASPRPEVEPDKEALSEENVKSLRRLGMENVETMTRDIAARLDIDFEPGVVVTQVRPGSVAASEGLVVGAIITKVMGLPVSTAKELAEQIGKRDLSKGLRVTAQIRGVNHFIFLALPQ